MALPDGLFICRNCPGPQNWRKQYKNHQNDWYKEALNEFTSNLLTRRQMEASYISTLVAELYSYCTRPTSWLTIPRKCWIPTSPWALPKGSLARSMSCIASVTISIAFKICREEPTINAWKQQNKDYLQLFVSTNAGLNEIFITSASPSKITLANEENYPPHPTPKWPWVLHIGEAGGCGAGLFS